MDELNTLSIIERIPDETAAYAFLEELRWKGRPVCPHCGNDDRCYFLNPAGGARRTSTGKTTARRLWKCGACRKQFSVLTGTVMHGSKIPLRTWILVVFEMASNKNGVASREIERRYGLTPKSAWFLLHRIREAMRPEAVDTLGGDGGVVVADETWVGGRPRNKHQQGRPIRLPGGGRGRAGHASKRTVVLSLIDRTSGEARSRVVPDVTGATLQKALREHVDVAGSRLQTDGWMGYREIGREFLAHEYVDHSRFEFVRGSVTSNQAENFFSQLKRSLDGTHHHVSKEHLGRYLGEFDFRYATKRANDTDRMLAVLDQAAGRRLTYERVTDRQPFGSAK